MIANKSINKLVFNNEGIDKDNKDKKIAGCRQDGKNQIAGTADTQSQNQNQNRLLQPFSSWVRKWRVAGEEPRHHNSS